MDSAQASPMAPERQKIASSAERRYVDEAAHRLRENPADLDALETVGAWLLAHDNAEKALECFHRITRLDPGYPGIWRLKARAFDAIGDRENAELCRRRGSDRRS